MKWIKSGLFLVVPHMLVVYSSVIYIDFILKIYSAYDPAAAKVKSIIHAKGNGLNCIHVCVVFFFCWKVNHSGK